MTEPKSWNADSRDQLIQRLELLNAVVCNQTDALFVKDLAGRYIFCNPAAAHYFGHPVEKIIGQSDMELFGVDIADTIRNTDQAVVNTGKRETQERILAVNEDACVYQVITSPWLNQNGEIVGVIGSARDVTERKRSEGLLVRQKHVLEKMIAGAPLETNLTAVVELVEGRLVDAMCSILLCDEEGRRLHFGAGPRLPEEYNRAVDGVPIAELSGSCGTAAHRGEIVIVADIATDPLWINYRDTALRHGLRSCWSFPIRAGEPKYGSARVLGTFAIYHHEPRVPSTEEVEIVGGAADLAGIAIERFNAERSLRESEDRFRTLVEQAADAFFLHDETGRFLDVNRQACETLGYTRDELLSKYVADVEQSADLPTITASWWKLQPGHYVTLDGRHRRKDGSEFPVEVHLGCMEQTGRRFIVALVRDVSRRKEAERQLRLNQFSIDHAVDSVFWIAPNAEILYVNDAACQTLGYAREEMVGKMVPEIDEYMTAEAWPAHWAELKQRGSFKFESDHKTKDGRLLKTEVTVNYLQYEGREYNCAVMRDISARRRLEQQLRESQKMEAIGKLAGGIAHDFNNLLTIINGYCELLLSRQLKESQWSDSVKEIGEAGRRAAQLTQQLLAFGRKALNEPKVLDLNSVVEGSEKLLRRLIGEQISLKVRLDPSLGLIKADVNQLEQVIMNLAVNSRDAMTHGGLLTIETSRTDRLTVPEIEQTGLSQGPYARLIVSDTGQGMAEDVLARIFEPFFTTKELGKGTGLGLSVVHGIVSQSGGRILASSTLGSGTKFQILFPVVSDPLHSVDLQLGDRNAPRGNETILLAEDEPGVRSLTRQILESRGYRVIEASSGDEALALAEMQTSPIHLLLTDVVMPGITGRQLAEYLRLKLPALAVLYISGYTEDSKVRRQDSGQTEAFLQKPFSPHELTRLVRKLIDDTMGSLMN